MPPAGSGSPEQPEPTTGYAIQMARVAPLGAPFRFQRTVSRRWQQLTSVNGQAMPAEEKRKATSFRANATAVVRQLGQSGQPLVIEFTVHELTSSEAARTPQFPISITYSVESDDQRFYDVLHHGERTHEKVLEDLWLIERWGDWRDRAFGSGSRRNVGETWPARIEPLYEAIELRGRRRRYDIFHRSDYDEVSGSSELLRAGAFCGVDCLRIATRSRGRATLEREPGMPWTKSLQTETVGDYPLDARLLPVLESSQTTLIETSLVNADRGRVSLHVTEITEVELVLIEQPRL